jgi:3-dehydroquinate synthase
MVKKKLSYEFSGQEVHYYLGESLENLEQYADPGRTVLIVDENVRKLHGSKLGGWRIIEVPAGEACKEMKTLQQVIDALVEMEVDRKTLLIGIGGGVTTDLTGFVASIYMRGIPFAFAPTTLLAQVDASIGGKNGINFGLYKNMLGIIRQPSFILFDYEVLHTLSEEERQNGFAEIIKYACIEDAALFDYLEKNREQALAGETSVIAYLVECSVRIKSRIVQADEFENGMRRWLNFGHTIGHAVEKLEKIAHGRAVAIGMVAASRLSEKMTGLPAADTARLLRLIQDYQLPVKMSADPNAVFDLFKMDKKREKDFIHFVLLEAPGKAVTQPIPLEILKEQLLHL